MHIHNYGSCSLGEGGGLFIVTSQLRVIVAHHMGWAGFTHKFIAIVVNKWYIQMFEIFHTDLYEIMTDT